MTTRITTKLPTSIGAGIGLAIFLAVALVPAVTYGGFAGVLLAGGAFGLPVTPTLASRAVIGAGMVLGVLSTGALFAFAGGAAGSAVAALVRMTMAEAADEA